MTEYRLDNKFNDAFKQASLGVSIGENNQLAEFAKILRSGAQMVELDLASLYGFTGQGTPAARITKKEREAIGNLARTTDSDLSVHAPWSINFSGINPKTGERNAEYMDLMKKEIAAAINFTDDVSKPMGRRNMPIIFHAASDNFGSPDPNMRFSVYDKEQDKAFTVGPYKIPNVTEREFLDRYTEIKKAYDKLEDEKERKKFIIQGEGGITLSPKATFAFLKDQEAMGYSQELASLDISQHNIELQKKQIADSLVDYSIRGTQKELNLIKMKELLDKEEQGIQNRRFLKEKQLANIDKRFTRFEEEAPVLAAEGIKDAAIMSAKTSTKPMILVENTMTPDMSLSDPTDVRETIDKARELFVEAAMNDKTLRLSRSGAEDLSRKLIGVNLDVGHLNIFKSYVNPDTGKPYSDKDIVKMAEKLGDYVKRYHLNDNMGDIDAHLPLGEGTAPIKEIYETLKNAGVDAPAIMEVFGGVGGITAGMGPSFQYMSAPLFDKTPYASLTAYAGNPYSSIVGDYSSYLNLGLRNDLFQYGGFSGIAPTFGAGYMDNKGGGDFSGAPMV